MDYFKILNLKQEPFSNSPDPAFFFQSRQHKSCLQKVELSIRMRRGLNVVVGDVGTGKTTLCRQLIRKFSKEDGLETHLILDPDFSTTTEFLRFIAEMIYGSAPPADADDWQLKERIKTYIYKRGVDENDIVVLIIDEGQKIPAFCLELLREFLNYETNEYKLLQIVIFAQKEFEETLQAHANFMDRINLHHLLEPLNFQDTRLMIRFRILQTSEVVDPPALFTFPALWAIYRATGGYPRRIIHLCHQSILAMIIQNKNRVNRHIVRSCIKRVLSRRSAKRLRFSPVLTVGIVFGIVAVAGFFTLNAEWFPYGTDSGNLSAPPVQTAMTVKVPQVPQDLPAVEEKTVSIELSVSADEDTATDEDTAADAAMAMPAVEPEHTDAVPVVAAVSTEPKRADFRPLPPAPKPDLLGTVTLERHDTLSWMCVKVYGIYNREIQARLVTANPDIGNLNNLWVGRKIRFPAVPVEVAQASEPVWWVRLVVADTLSEAFDVIRKDSRKEEPLRIIPHWNPVEGLKFSVALWGYFFDQTAAADRLRHLGRQTGHTGNILSAWLEETVFFTDPYMGKGH